jgi:hypothetical protein
MPPLFDVSNPLLDYVAKSPLYCYEFILLMSANFTKCPFFLKHLLQSAPDK